MSGRRKSSRNRGRGGGDNKPRTVDLWRPVPPLPVPEAITPSNEPAALVRSLGHPPLAEQSVVAGHYLAAVVERGAILGTALASAAGLLAPNDDSDDDEPVI
jgi:hypothetical protein